MERLKPAAVATQAEVPLFGPRAIYLRDGSSQLPEFEDDVWDLSALEPQAQLKRPILNFTRVPEPYVMSAKELALAILTSHQPGRGPTAPTTAVHYHYLAKQFFEWLHENGIARLDSVSDEDLVAYRDYQLRKGGKTFARVSAALQLLYKHREQFTSGLSVDPHVVTRGVWARRVLENSTPRIPEDVLAPLVRWAARWVHDLADDVIDAKHEFVQIRSGDRRFGNPAPTSVGQERLRLLLGRYRCARRPLPARRDERQGALVLHLKHLAREANCTMDVVQRVARHEVEAAVLDLGLEDGMRLWHVPRGTVGDKKWMETIPFWDVARLVTLLQTSCYIVIAMFSGMRDAEIKQLERGCLKAARTSDGLPVRWSVRGRAFKGEPVGGSDATWRVGDLAADAIRVLERLQSPEQRLLFGTDMRLQRNTKRYAHPGARPRTVNETNTAMRDLVTWSNQWCEEHDFDDRIPDHDGEPWPVTTRQFRRTLAWFIARRPGGSIAGAKQFRHLSIQMFEGYAGTSRAGFRAEVEAEEALARGEFLLAMVDQHAHEELAGPAAHQGRERLSRFGELATFRGVVAESPTQLKRLLASEDPAIYTSDLVTCVFDPDRALCLQKTKRNSPDLGQCDPFNCANVAVTPSNRAHWRDQITEISALLERANGLPPYVAQQLRDTRARILDKFLNEEGI